MRFPPVPGSQFDRYDCGVLLVLWGRYEFGKAGIVRGAAMGLETNRTRDHLYKGCRAWKEEVLKLKRLGGRKR